MRNIDELAPVPLFVKAPSQKRGRTLPWYVCTTDVAPTIADLVDARLPYRPDGRSAFSRAVRARRSAMVIERDFRGRLRSSAGRVRSPSPSTGRSRRPASASTSTSPRPERARTGESFAVMVPERSIRPGRNRVEIYEIVADGLALRLLGST